MFEGRPLTTRGRWWNPVVFRNLRLAARGKGGKVDRPVFIVGMGRSGTTLLGRVLAAHPHVGFLNEPKAMWHVIRDDEDVIGSYPKLPGRLYLDRADAGDAVARRAHSLYAWYLTASRSRRLVDKYPELIFRHEFVRAIFPDARFLIAIREPFAALESVARWSVSHERDGVDWWGLDDLKWRILWSEGVAGRPANSDLAELGLSAEEDGRVRAAVEWLVTAREAIELMDRDPAASPVLHERLAGEPRAETRRILRACRPSAQSADGGLRGSGRRTESAGGSAGGWRGCRATRLRCSNRRGSG